MRAPWSLAVAFAIAGCGWGSLPDHGWTSLDRPLWSPHDVLPTADGLYVPLPHAGKLVLIRTDGTWSEVPTGEGRVKRLVASPGAGTVLAFVERYRCKTRSADRRIRTVDDCPPGDLVSHTEVVALDGAEVTSRVMLPSTYNALAFSDDGRFAIAWLDFTDPDLEVSGVVSLTSVVVLDLAQGTATPVSVGFAADRALFVQDEDGRAVRAVVLSRNSVALVDLTLEVPARSVTFPLTLDPDTEVVPVGVALTPDGRHAIIPVQGRRDLYLLDLVGQSINIVELAGLPSDVAVHAGLDRTVLVYSDTPQAEVLEHAFFDLTTLDLDEPMDHVAQASEFVVLYGTADQHDVYRLDVASTQLVEYRLENPAVSLHVAPTEDFAIALTRPEMGGGSPYDASPGMEILDLRGDDTQPFLLEGQGLGVAWSHDGARLVALVLQEGVEYLYQLDPYTGRATQLDLPQPPLSIGSMLDGTFYVTHDNRLGLISFFDPATQRRVEVEGFAALGIMDPIEVLTTEAE